MATLKSGRCFVSMDSHMGGQVDYSISDTGRVSLTFTDLEGGVPYYLSWEGVSSGAIYPGVLIEYNGEDYPVTVRNHDKGDTSTATITLDFKRTVNSLRIYGYRGGSVLGEVTDHIPGGAPTTLSSWPVSWEVANSAPTATLTAGTLYAGKEVNVSWSYSDPDNDDVTLVSLIRYYKAAGGTRYSGTTLLSDSTLKSYKDTIPSTYGGASVYYEITFADSLGATGTEKTAAVTVIANSAPSKPGIPVLPARINGGETVSVSWKDSTDADGNLEGYKLERSSDGGKTWVQAYQGADSTVNVVIPAGIDTVMYRVKAYDTYGAESGYAVTENLTVYNNTTPDAPVNITVPNVLYSGTSAIISWAAVTDPDGDPITYHVERAANGGTFAEVFTTDKTSFTDRILANWRTVTYRVCAVDSNGARSGYVTSATVTVITNHAPTIQIDNAPEGMDYGIVTEPFSIQYTFADLDGAVSYNLRVTLDGSYIYGSMGKHTDKGWIREVLYLSTFWKRIANGEHTLTFRIDDGKASNEVSVYFTKLVTDAVITLDEPMTSTEQISVCIISVNGEIPADAEMTVEVTNNANDTAPVWEDATAQVAAGLNHAFTNTTAANGWAFNFRVTVHGGATRGFITSIQGGFQ